MFGQAVKRLHPSSVRMFVLDQDTVTDSVIERVAVERIADPITPTEIIDVIERIEAAEIDKDRGDILAEQEPNFLQLQGHCTNLKLEQATGIEPTFIAWKTITSP